MPLSPFLPCQSFMNASGGEVAVGEPQTDNMPLNKGGNSRATGAMAGLLCCCITALFFHYMLIKDASLHLQPAPGAKQAADESRREKHVV